MRARVRRLVGTAVLAVAVAGSVGAAHPAPPVADAAAQAQARAEATQAAAQSTLASQLVARLSPARVERMRIARQPSLSRSQSRRAGAGTDSADRAAPGWQLPVAPGAYHLTSRFGECSYLWSRCHTGLDFAAPSGTPIRAVASGTVTETGWAGAYGYRTVLTLGDGTELWFCHQTSVAVATGQQVAAGAVIGTVGSTGNVTGPHLHLEVRPGAGDPVDPVAVLAGHGVTP